MKTLRFQEGVSWTSLGGNPSPPQLGPDDLARSMENDLHMRPSVVTFVQKAVVLAEHDPHRALALVDRLMLQRANGGYFAQPLSPNELIAVHELQGTALSQGLEPRDLHAYRNLLLAKPNFPNVPSYNDGFDRRR